MARLIRMELRGKMLGDSSREDQVLASQHQQWALGDPRPAKGRSLLWHKSLTLNAVGYCIFDKGFMLEKG